MSDNYVFSSDAARDLSSNSTNPLSEFVHSALYSMAQSPANAMAEIFVGNAEAAPKIIDAPKQAALGTGTWLAQQFGSAAGMIPIFLLTDYAVGKAFSYAGANKLITKNLSNAVVRSAVSGATVEGLFSPTGTTGENHSLALDRFKQAAKGAATFSALTAGTLGLGRLGEINALNGTRAATLLGDRFMMGTLSGGLSGLVAAEAESLLAGKGFATASDVATSVFNMAVIGGPFSALHGDSSSGKRKNVDTHGIENKAAPAIQTVSPETAPIAEWMGLSRPLECTRVELQQRAELAIADAKRARTIDQTKPLKGGAQAYLYTDGVSRALFENRTATQLLDGTRVTEYHPQEVAPNYIEPGYHKVGFADGSWIKIHPDGGVLYERPLGTTTEGTVVEHGDPWSAKQQLIATDGSIYTIDDMGRREKTWKDEKGLNHGQDFDSLLSDGSRLLYPDSGPTSFEGHYADGSVEKIYRPNQPVIAEWQHKDGSRNIVHRQGDASQTLTTARGVTYAEYADMSLGIRTVDGELILPVPKSMLAKLPIPVEHPNPIRLNRSGNVVEPISIQDMPDGGSRRTFRDGTTITEDGHGTISAQLPDGTKITSGVAYNFEGNHFPVRHAWRVEVPGREPVMVKETDSDMTYLHEIPEWKETRTDNGLYIRESQFDGTLAVIDSSGTELRVRPLNQFDSHFLPSAPEMEGQRFTRTGQHIEPLSVSTNAFGERTLSYADGSTLLNARGGEQILTSRTGERTIIRRLDKLRASFPNGPLTTFSVESLSADGNHTFSHVHMPETVLTGPRRAWSTVPAHTETLLPDGTRMRLSAIDGQYSFSAPDQNSSFKFPKSTTDIKETDVNPHDQRSLGEDNEYSPAGSQQDWSRDLPAGTWDGGHPLGLDGYDMDFEPPVVRARSSAGVQRTNSAGHNIEPAQTFKATNGDLVSEFDDKVRVSQDKQSGTYTVTFQDGTKYTWTSDNVFTRVYPDGSKFVRYADGTHIGLTATGELQDW